jgi:hypothetical protein
MHRNIRRDGSELTHAHTDSSVYPSINLPDKDTPISTSANDPRPVRTKPDTGNQLAMADHSRNTRTILEIENSDDFVG